MSNKTFIIVILAVILGFGGYLAFNQKSKPKEVLLGINHPDQGQEHIAQGKKHQAYNSDPASSGPHYSDTNAPAPWGVYTQQVPEEVFVHNEEHGGIIITYSPQLLAADQLKKIQKLVLPPYSNKDFTPSKMLVTPRFKNTHAIEIASWRYTLNLDNYDEATIIKYYRQHIGQSPESSAGPTNTPQIIN